ncbi:DUF2752 domain-containing protein [Streptomyces durbertensis]|uniref:DUF2752 domain-containing protein n=1 Tax=Streptomyces durbertensis TaxID=2448886 RepID=A0ABR6EC34_9ACTN|nr:DUF2752 domain-containing protein [Streptomyces durbertensis]MBB1242884.1 DUF2752 domain-containing protein [Streptomyces durbertensis]
MTSARLPALAALAATAAAVAVVGVVDPNEPGRYPVCPLLRHTGVLCPGCGGLRSVHALAHGDLPAALAANVLVVLALLVAAGWWLRWFALAGRPRRPTRTRRTPLLPLWCALGLVTVFTVVRNLPFGAAFAP